MHLFGTREQVSFGAGDALFDQLLLLLRIHEYTYCSCALHCIGAERKVQYELQSARHVDEVAVLGVHERERAELLAPAHHLVQLVRLEHYGALIGQERLERVHAALVAQHTCAPCRTAPFMQCGVQ